MAEEREKGQGKTEWDFRGFIRDYSGARRRVVPRECDVRLSSAAVDGQCGVVGAGIGVAGSEEWGEMVDG